MNYPTAPEGWHVYLSREARSRFYARTVAPLDRAAQRRWRQSVNAARLRRRCPSLTKAEARAVVRSFDNDWWFPATPDHLAGRESGEWARTFKKCGAAFLRRDMPRRLAYYIGSHFASFEFACLGGIPRHTRGDRITGDEIERNFDARAAARRAAS